MRMILMRLAASSLSLVIMPLATGCTTIIRNPVETLYKDGVEALPAAISQNDADAVRSILKGKSFKTLGLWGGHHEWEEDSAYELIDVAITGIAGNGHYNAPTGFCRSGIVQALLDAGLPPRPLDLENAANVACPDVMEVILPKLSAVDIATGINQFITLVKKEIQKNTVEYRGPPARWTQVFKLLSEYADKSGKESIAEISQLLDGSLYKPVRNSQDSKQKLESKYKMSFCSKSNFFAVVFDPTGGPIEQGCLYLVSGPFKVLQATGAGILVTLVDSAINLSSKVFFIRTSKRYADESLVGDILVHSIGVTSYLSVLGAQTTVHAFEYLGDVKLIHGNIDGENYLAPNQE